MDLKSNFKAMYIMRGLPGSGKSTMAQYAHSWYINHLFTSTVITTDDFWYNEKNEYIFDPTRLKEAHEWNLNRAIEAIEAKLNVIIIDNVHSQFWEAEKYVIHAFQNGYAVELKWPTNPWSENVDELFERNLHNVPREVIQAMKDRFESHEEFQEKINQLALTTHRIGV